MTIQYFESNCTRFRHAFSGSLVSAHVYGLLFVDPDTLRGALEQYYCISLGDMVYSVDNERVSIHWKVS